MNTLLEGSYWPHSLCTRDAYVRVHDDTDGQRGPEQEIHVAIGPDGDAWICGAGNSLRFRTHAGGGKSPRVRNALLMLAEAIRRDNEDAPQA